MSHSEQGLPQFIWDLRLILVLSFSISSLKNDDNAAILEIALNLYISRFSYFLYV